MARVVNLTPHAINILVGDDKVITIPPSGQVARCEVSRTVVGHLMIDGHEVPLTRTRFGEVQGLPDPEPGTVYVVSAIVAQARPDRTDLVIPDDVVRDEEGRVIGCRALANPFPSW